MIIDGAEGKYNGTVVAVVVFDEIDINFRGQRDRFWWTDLILPSGKKASVAESCLRRINDDNNASWENIEAYTGGWNPTKITVTG